MNKTPPLLHALPKGSRASSRAPRAILVALSSAVLLLAACGSQPGRASAPAPSESAPPGIDELAESCSHNEQVACRRLGALGGEYEGADAQRRNAILHAWAKACQSGPPDFCAATAFFLEGKGELEFAKSFLTMGCKRGVEIACAHSTMLQPPPGVTVQHEDLGACADGSADACFRLAYKNRQDLGDPKVEKWTAAVLQVACLGGDTSSCQSAQRLPEVAAKARLDREQLLGHIERMVDEHANPSLVGTQPPESAPMTDAESKAVGEDYAQGQARCSAMTAAECEAACKAEKAPSLCTAMAGRHFEGTGLPRDPDRAMKEWGDLCKAEYRPACIVLEELAKQASECTTLSNCKEGCGRALAPACNRLGEAYLNGRGTPKNNPAALAAFERGCRGNSAASCKMLGFMYREGLGAPRNLKTARELFQKACDTGADEACGAAFTTGCFVEAITPKQRRAADDFKCQKVRDSGKNFHARESKTYSAFEAPDESKLNQCLEPMFGEGCFQVNMTGERAFRAVYCCPR